MSIWLWALAFGVGFSAGGFMALCAILRLVPDDETEYGVFRRVAKGAKVLRRLIARDRRGRYPLLKVSRPQEWPDPPDHPVKDEDTLGLVEIVDDKERRSA